LEQKKELIEKTVNVHQLSLFGENLGFDDDEDEKKKEADEKMEVMSDIIDEIEEKDINNITPMEALKFLSELKAKLEEKK